MPVQETVDLPDEGKCDPQLAKSNLQHLQSLGVFGVHDYLKDGRDIKVIPANL